jgi:uncharacterized protein (DUF58 family)
MPGYPELLASDALDKVAKLRLIARTVVESFVSGQHRSVYKGFSVEFAQHREYNKGDEIRHIDWKVFAKSDRLFIKQYEEETNLRATLVLDCSGSMAYGGISRFGGGQTGQDKFSYAVCCAAALAYLMIGQSDSVGLVTLDTKIRSIIPAKSTTTQLSNLLKILAATLPGGETNLAPVLEDLGGQLRRRGLLIICSDFFAPADDLIRALGLFHHQRHEVILMQILHPHEIEFPFQDVAEFHSLENSGHKIKVDAGRIRKMYLERFEKFSARLKEVCHRFRFDHLMLRTDQPFDEALAHYLRRRLG